MTSIFRRTGVPAPSRRRFLGLTGGVALAGVLAACGSTDSPAPAAGRGDAPSGPWEFTDDRGKKVTLPRRPQNIVVQISAAASLVDFGITPTGVFGPRTLADGKPDPQAGDVDPAIPSVGTEFGEFSMEKFLGLKPELVVTIMYGESLWYVPEESQAAIEATAPIVGIQLGGVSATEAIGKFEALAEALGADVATPTLVRAKKDFETAAAGLAQATAAKPGLTTLVVQGSKDILYIGKPDFFSDLKFFTEKGLDIVTPTGGDAPTWEELSWEQAGTYPADLILTDAREMALSQGELAKIPTWATLPAVKSGQLGLWHAETPYSYQKYAGVLTELTGVVRKARTDVVA